MVYVALIFIQVLFGFNFFTSKIVLKSIDPYTFSFIRFFLSGLTLLLICLIKKTVIKKSYDWKKLILLSLLGVSLGQTLFLVGLNYTTSVNASILMTTIPIFTLLIALIRKQISIRFSRILGFFLAFVGVVILNRLEQFSWESNHSIGNMIMLGSCFNLALFLSFSRDYFHKNDPLTGTAIIFLLGSLTLFPIQFLLNSFIGLEHYYNLQILEQGRTTMALLYSVFGATLLTYFLNNWALAKVNPALVSLFMFLQPLIASILGMLYLSERVGGREALSYIFVILGVTVAVKRDLFSVKKEK